MQSCLAKRQTHSVGFAWLESWDWLALRRSHEAEAGHSGGVNCLGVCEPAILQDLKHHVEDVRVGLLNLIEQHHCVGPPPDGLCQLAALVVAHIACVQAQITLRSFRLISTALQLKEMLWSRDFRLR